MTGLGPCSICGHVIAFGAAFVNIGPTDWDEPDRPKLERFVPVDHGWSPFVMMHAACYAHQEGVDRLRRLVDESHRLLRKQMSG